MMRPLWSAIAYWFSSLLAKCLLATSSSYHLPSSWCTSWPSTVISIRWATLLEKKLANYYCIIQWETFLRILFLVFYTIPTDVPLWEVKHPSVDVNCLLLISSISTFSLKSSRKHHQMKHHPTLLRLFQAKSQANLAEILLWTCILFFIVIVQCGHLLHPSCGIVNNAPTT